jgi:hypothetical protein
METNSNTQDNEIKIDKDKANRLLKKVIVMERNNLKTKQMNDQQMVKWIKKQIEEEAGCY